MTSVKLPNFLIVGAAKSGTTSIYHYLKQHPEIYMSPVKEPSFFTAQFVKYSSKIIKRKPIIVKYEEYKKLFEKVTHEKAIGEASVDYLFFYEGCIKLIKEYVGDIKIIIILRNPIEMVFSMYQMFAKLGQEPLSFADALNADADPLNAGQERKRLHWGFYCKQVRAYIENFTHVKVYLFDDLKSDPLGLIKDMYRFLEVDDTFIPEINIKYNVGGIPKSKFVHRLLLKVKIFKPFIMRISRLFFLEEKMFKLAEMLDTINLEKLQMKPETRDYLKELYREDILKLQALIDRDVSRWLK